MRSDLLSRLSDALHSVFKAESVARLTDGLSWAEQSELKPGDQVRCATHVKKTFGYMKDFTFYESSLWRAGPEFIEYQLRLTIHAYWSA
ncbi:MAG TPA: hypothetical protein VF624_06955 [Tepidisphaeraceae bacterium]